LQSIPPSSSITIIIITIIIITIIIITIPSVHDQPEGGADSVMSSVSVLAAEPTACADLPSAAESFLPSEELPDGCEECSRILLSG